MNNFKTMWGRRFPIAFNTPRKLLDLLAAIKNNQFAICDEEKSTTELGSAIYLNASLLNHSCAPNAVPLFSGLKLYVKALKKIEPGDGNSRLIKIRNSLSFQKSRLHTVTPRQ